MHRGFIKIWRRIDDWDWADDLITVGFFCKLILMANYKDKRWHGIVVPRGSFVSSRSSLAKKFNVSEQRIRTLIGRLKSTNEITTESTSSYTLYTIVNYNKFQNNEIQSTSEATSNVTNFQPATNQPSTSDQPQLKKEKNIKNEKNEKNLKPLSNKFDDRVVEVFEYWKEQLNHPKCKLDKKRGNAIKGRLKEGYDVDRIKQAIRGIKFSAHHMGQNDRNTVYDDIELICRTGAKVDQFAEMEEKGVSPTKGINVARYEKMGLM